VRHLDRPRWSHASRNQVRYELLALADGSRMRTKRLSHLSTRVPLAERPPVEPGSGPWLRPLRGALRQVYTIAPHLPESVQVAEVALFRGTGQRYYSGGVGVRVRGLYTPRNVNAEQGQGSLCDLSVLLYCSRRNLSRGRSG
jgi:hypothetical protein